VVLRASGLIGADVDGEGGRSLSRALIPSGWPATVTVRSGRADGGLHLWYRAPEGEWPAKIEFSGKGLKTSSDGYLVAPPALHGETGAEYAFVEGRAPWEHELVVAPSAILAALVAARRAHTEAERTDDASHVTEGDRHDFLMRKGCSMRRAGFSEEAIRAALLIENRRRCAPPKDEHLVAELAADLCKRYPPGARA
jgi:putative DNA primase/helicase